MRHSPEKLALAWLTIIAAILISILLAVPSTEATAALIPPRAAPRTPVSPLADRPEADLDIPPEEARLRKLASRLVMGELKPAGYLVKAARRCGLAVDDLLTGDPGLVLVIQTLASCASSRNPRYRIVNPSAGSNAETAYRTLVNEGTLRGAYLVILSVESTGAEGEIYRRLRQRKFRATIGADEGIDTAGLFCYPGCIFVPREELNAIGLPSWRGVLLHESRHIEQLRNNPHMAADFRGPNRRFTTYAAFCEACADDGLYTTPMYHARETMAILRGVTGPDSEALIRKACQGDKAAYASLVSLYDAARADQPAFASLFRPYY